MLGPAAIGGDAVFVSLYAFKKSDFGWNMLANDSVWETGITPGFVIFSIVVLFGLVGCASSLSVCTTRRSRMHRCFLCLSVTWIFGRIICELAVNTSVN